MLPLSIAGLIGLFYHTQLSKQFRQYILPSQHTTHTHISIRMVKLFKIGVTTFYLVRATFGMLTSLSYQSSLSDGIKSKVRVLLVFRIISNIFSFIKYFIHYTWMYIMCLDLISPHSSPAPPCIPFLLPTHLYVLSLMRKQTSVERQYWLDIRH